MPIFRVALLAAHVLSGVGGMARGARAAKAGAGCPPSRRPLPPRPARPPPPPRAAPPARALQPQRHDAVRHAEDLDVAAVGLQVGPHLGQRGHHALHRHLARRRALARAREGPPGAVGREGSAGWRRWW
jgi:hypothetical protein